MSKNQNNKTEPQVALAGSSKAAPAPRRLIDCVRPGDWVTIITPHDSKLSGRAVMRSSAGGWVLNGGGRHGAPLLANDSNTINVRSAKR